MTKRKARKKENYKRPFSPRVKFNGTCYPYYEEFRLTHGLVLEERMKGE